MRNYDLPDEETTPKVKCSTEDTNATISALSLKHRQLYFKNSQKINTFAKPLINMNPCALAGIKELQAELW